jgi:polyhydroxyalkanoate synthase
MNDLMAWNADATRMPFRMQSSYLRQLFLNNDLFEGRYRIDGRPLSLGDIHVPSFVVATETDHVAPWRSVYKLNLAIGADMTFLLTSGGHNAGICSEPGHPRRHYRVMLLPHSDNYVDPDRWLRCTPAREGSWWPVWANWLEAEQQQRPSHSVAGSDSALPAAPGEYVLQK